MSNRDSLTGRYAKTPDQIMGFSASKMLGSVGKDLLSFTSQFTSTAVSSLKNFISSIKSFLAQLTSMMWGGLTKMLGGVASGIGKMVSLTASLILKGISGLAGGLGGAIQNVASTLVRIMGGVVSGAFTVLVNGAKVLAGALAGIALGLTKATQAAANYGRSLTDFRASTGLGYGAGAGILNRNSALGISREQTQSTFGAQNPGLFGLKASIWGLPGYNNPDFMPQVAGRYQSMMGSGNLGSQLMAGQMMGMLGMDSPEMRRAAMMPQGEMRSQLAYQRNVQSGLGVDPRMIADVTRQFDSLTGRLRILSDTALVRLGAEVLPRVNAGLEVLTNVLANNVGNISTSITKGVTAAFSGLATFGTFMLSLPKLFISAGESMLAFASTAINAIPVVWTSFLQGVSTVQAAVQPLFSGIASGFDYLAQVVPPIISQVTSGITTVITTLQNGIIGFGSAALEAFTGIEGVINRILSNDIVKSALRALGAGAEVAQTVARVAGPVHEGARKGLEGVGVKPGYSDLLSFLGVGLAGRSLLGIGSRALLGAGAGGAASGAAGVASFLPQWIPKFLPMGLAAQVPTKGIAGLASRMLLNPVGAGIAVGLGGYSALQSRGYLGKDAPGLGEALSNMLARLTGGEVTQQNGYTASQNAARQAPRASDTPITDRMRNSMSSLMANLQSYSYIPGDLATHFSAGMQRGRQNNNSIAQGLSNRYGGSIDHVTMEGHRIVEKMYADLRGIGQSTENSEILRMLANILKVMQGVNANTKPNQSVVERLEQALKNNGNQVLGHAMNAYAQNAALGTLRTG
jgi:hypothetical protein